MLNRRTNKEGKPKEKEEGEGKQKDTRDLRNKFVIKNKNVVWR